MSSARFARPKTLALNLATAGTPQRISSTELICSSFIIEAKPTNTGNVWIADSSTNCTSARGQVLEPGQKLPVSGDQRGGSNIRINLYDFFWDGAVTNDDVSVMYFEEFGS